MIRVIQGCLCAKGRFDGYVLPRYQAFYPPQPDQNLFCARVRLNEGLHRKLTLISTSAGFGKITLVTGWIQATGKASLPVAIGNAAQLITVAWLSLNDDDIDLARFLTYYIAVLYQSKGMDATFGKGVISMLLSFHPPQ